MRLFDTLSPRLLFRVDAFGAALSALLLGVVLMQLEHVFGMPQEALVVLAALPVVFAAYDLICLASHRADRPRFLRGIAGLNLAYCALSVGYLSHHAAALTTLGWFYFIAELALVLGLAAIQLRVAARVAAARPDRLRADHR